MFAFLVTVLNFCSTVRVFVIAFIFYAHIFSTHMYTCVPVAYELNVHTRRPKALLTITGK